MFETFTDEQFAIWLAGFFDGEGCITIPKKAGIDVNIANTNRAVIEGIYNRLGAGVIIETTYDNQKWKTKYSWRLRTYEESAGILKMMRPYLTIKAAKADEALILCAKYLDKLQRTADRNAQIIEIAQNNPKTTHREIAAQFGMCRSGITQILSGGIARRKPRRRESFVSYRERHIKNKVQVKTSCKILD